MKPLKKPLRRHNRAGQSLVEFAVVSLVLYMLLAAILTFGHMLYVAQGLQGAADLAAREISRTPISADIGSLKDALDVTVVRSRIYDPAYLVIDLDVFYGNDPDGDVFRDIFGIAPLLNQQLALVMIVDRPVVGGVQRWLMRYPGALLIASPLRIHPLVGEGQSYNDAVATDLKIEIPLISASSNTVRWVNVVEEIGPANETDPRPFSIDNQITRGIVALRINYPFQSASMSSFRHDRAAVDFPFEPTVGRPIIADDGELNPGDRSGSLTGAPLQNGPVYAGTYGGQYGLGAQGALGSDQLTGGRPVRPYRRVISAQAIYRREVFEW